MTRHRPLSAAGFHESEGTAFPKTYRLGNTREFQLVFRSARRHRAPGFLLLVRPNNLGFPRLGLAISKRAARRAVDRNRLKRVAREAFRNHKSDLPNVDIVVLCTPAATTLPNSKLVAGLQMTWLSITESACVDGSF